MTKKKIPLDQNDKFDLFSLPEFRKVRKTVINGVTYYAAYDVAIAIGFSQPRSVVSRRCGNSAVAPVNSGKGRSSCRVITIREVYWLLIRAVTQNGNLLLRERVEPYIEMMIDILVEATAKTKE